MAKHRVLSPINGVNYSNIAMISPDGLLMSYISKNKADWYIKRGLAEYTESDSNSRRLQLKFKPQGLGNHNDPFHMNPKSNLCVVCGTVEHLTRHHCVPRCFRKFFPDDFKINASHDVVALCDECHSNYEQYANALKSNLIDSYSATPEDWSYVSAISAAHVLSNPLVPDFKKQMMRERLAIYLQKEEVTEDDISEFAQKKRPNFGSRRWRDFVQDLNDYDEFIRMWRKHFIEITQPKYLPKHWDIDYAPNH